MPDYIVKFTGRLTIEAENKQEALENFYANILEMFEESEISDVKVSDESDESTP